MKNKIQILIAWEGKLLPMYIEHEISKKLKEDGESTDDGLVGEYFYHLFKEAQKAIGNCTKQSGDEDADDERTKKLVRWGFKIKEIETNEEDNSSYKLIDHPIKDDSGNPV